jgi:ABC-type transport system involved in multi-copper enzyme maturation permease subunit
MSARLVRMKKEARALFWPWCAVLIAGVLPIVVPHEYAEPLSFISFFLGVPVLATLSIGNEFHGRTLSLWLTQPFSRMQLWGEKMIVMCSAALSAGFVSGVVMASFTWPHMKPTYKLAAIVYVLITIASATLWTLTARSTLGALTLFVAILFLGSLFSGGISEPPRPGQPLQVLPSLAATVTIIPAGTCFAALMLWLGVRKLARFQVAGGSADGDLLMAGPAFMPEGLAAWFRARPSGAVLNLIRKELRLLRPLWVIELLVLLYVACLAMFRLFPSPPVAEPRTVLQWALFGPLVSVCIAMAGLTGILSLGEEKTTGTHAWHMTLPISSGQQWLIKFVVAMLAGPACAVLLPVLTMIVAGAFFGSAWMYVNPGGVRDDLILAAVLTFTCFWCACAANGTVRAAAWTLPLTVAVVLAMVGGTWLGQELARTTGTLKDFVVSSFHLNPQAFTSLAESTRASVLWTFVPTLLFGIFQSRRLFRTEPRSGPLWLLRCLMPPVLVTILWSFTVAVGLLASHWQPFDETHQALDRLQASGARLEVRGESLAKDARLTAVTRHWLKGSSIIVEPEHSHSSSYVATIHLASGVECRLTAVRGGGTAAACGGSSWVGEGRR